ncbi:MAG: 4Fe-4S binding protein, partial [Sedimentisphaerales bacterium]|nr:4Fe-4S binding protein [Sedimentisphaerales bacterium]
GGQPIPKEPIRLIPLAVTYLFINGIFFLMIYSGRISRYRTILFVIYAICFVLTFTTNLIETRGSMILTQEDMVKGHTPLCHMVIPMLIIPAALTKTIIFPGSMLEGFASIGSMLVLWLGVSIVLGRGWCSWGCFYGGLDEGFSKIGRKPVIKRIDKKWTYLPFAILLVVVLTSAAAMSPTYCSWLCPFKAVTEFEDITSAKVLLQTVIFFSLFIGLVVVMPVLTKRRTQCGLFCPMGAMQSLTNKLNVFDLRIDKDKCKQCNLCVKSCPVFAMDEESVRNGGTRITCSKCGKCVEACPSGAISFHIKGTDVGSSEGKARLMFIYPAFLLLAIMGSGMIAGAIYRVLMLITTGSMFK